MTQPMGDPCPVCRRMDGGHDKAMHDAADQGITTYPGGGK